MTPPHTLTLPMLATLLLVACGSRDTPDHDHTDLGATMMMPTDMQEDMTSKLDLSRMPDIGSADMPDAPAALITGLPITQSIDEEAAELGWQWLRTGALSEGLMPETWIRHLYIVWTDDLLAWSNLYQNEQAYWDAFRQRYGFQNPLEGSTDIALGLHRKPGAEITFGCVMCHATTVAGRLTWGTNNHELRLALLQEELEAMPEAIEQAKQRPLPPQVLALLNAVPQPGEVPLSQARWVSQGPGLHDAMGYALILQGAPSDIHEGWGVQSAPAWWTSRFRERVYLDGSGKGQSHRSMMAMHLAFGLTPTEARALEPNFETLRHAILATPIPTWEDWGLPAPNQAEVSQGRAIFATTCASCHGTYEGEDVNYPEYIGDVGTDMTRGQAMTQARATYINQAIFTDAFSPSTGYLAPALTGIFARAPYLHNGSVPTLWALLTPEERPETWAPAGHGKQDYDVDHVGWRTINATPAIPRYQSVETSSQGHTFGASLSKDERLALIAYLKTL